MKFGWLSLALFTGLLIPVQAAMNARMWAFVRNPFYSALVNFTVGAAAVSVLAIITTAQGQPGSWRAAAGAPWWAWGGGLIGVMLVMGGVLLLPRVGAAAFLVTLIAGQLGGALLLDHFGWLGLTTRSISLARLAGAVLVLLGVWLIQRK